MARINDDDHGFEQDHWKKTRKITEIDEPLRADRWFYKNMGKNQDEKVQKSNHQDFVFIRPPGISNGAYNLRMDDIWLCKILLLFQVESKTDLGMKRHSGAMKRHSLYYL